jgi:hypothetical protein
VVTPAIVLGEGLPDEKFINKLAEARGLSQFVTRNPQKGESSYGKDGFAKRLSALRIETNIEEQKAVLIVADNDLNPTEAFKNVQRRIQESNKDEDRKWGVPDKPRDLVASSGSLPSIAILMIPWDDEPGCLKTICFEAATQRRPEHAECIKALVECAKAESWAIGRLSKLRMRVMISSLCEKDPNTVLQWIWTEGRDCPTDIAPLSDKSFNRMATYLSAFGT